jgi:hypothetical protein
MQGSREYPQIRSKFWSARHRLVSSVTLCYYYYFYYYLKEWRVNSFTSFPPT